MLVENRGGPNGAWNHQTALTTTNPRKGFVMAETILRRCPGCALDRPEDHFYPPRVTNKCRACLTAYKRQHYVDNADKYKERAKAAMLRDVDGYRAAARARAKVDPAAPARKKAYKARHADRVKLQNAAYRARHATKIGEAVSAWRRENKAKLCHYAAKRRVAKGLATPAWADHGFIEGFYIVAAAWTAATGVPHEVDHIIPIQGDGVCGLHVPANLQVLPRSVNRAKANKL
jgi:hypothetical protein